jgi:hypothetical protein
MPFILDTKAPPAVLTAEVKANIVGGAVRQRGGVMPLPFGLGGPPTSILSAASGIVDGALNAWTRVAENIIVGAVNIAATAINHPPIVGLQQQFDERQGMDSEIFAEMQQDQMAERLGDTGYSMSYAENNPLPDMSGLPATLAIAPPAWADQEVLGKQVLMGLLIGSATIALTLTVAAYIKRRMRPDGKVVVDDEVVELAKRGVDAASKGDNAGLLAAQKEIEQLGKAPVNTPTEEELFARPNANSKPVTAAPAAPAAPATPATWTQPSAAELSTLTEEQMLARMQRPGQAPAPAPTAFQKWTAEGKPAAAPSSLSKYGLAAPTGSMFPESTDAKIARLEAELTSTGGRGTYRKRRNRKTRNRKTHKKF